MFNQMYLAIEQNKLKGRFGGTVTTAILEVLNKETDVKHQEYIYQVLSRFNATVKVVEVKGIILKRYIPRALQN